MDIMAQLNQSQQEAANFTEGYLRVIAGAGSGKTKLLVSRYANLVKNYGIDSANILCVTFTNKAAGEMRRRIRALVGEGYDTSLICTYHGFCARVLREDAGKIFFPENFQIIDTQQQKAILEDIYQKFELKLDYASFERKLKEIAFIKRNYDYVERMCSREKCRISDSIKSTDEEIVEEFLQRQKQNFALDFHDLINFVLYLFKKVDSVASKWQERLNYIQVDEFQDSSGKEMELVNVLSGMHKNLMIVGDPDQNIYEWRGSDVKLLVDFDKHYDDVKTVFLNRNYRSTPEILNCANTLIENNRYRIKKDLYTKNDGGEAVVHIHAKTENEEMEKIVEHINRLKKRGYRYSDFAVLYRSGFLSRVIENKFNENGIPYEIFGGVKFFLRMEIQDILAYLRLLVFDDDVSLRRIVNTPKRRFGRVKMQRLNELRQDKSLFDTLCENLDDSVLKNSGAGELCKFILDLRKEINNMKIPEIVEQVCEKTGYEAYIRELGDMERLENLSEFKRICYEYERNFGEKVTLQEFLNQITLQVDTENDEESDLVKLMTIHSAKGLEFPVVFVTGFTEGIFPSSKTIEDRKELGLEEERRLCYVALTRAEKQLYLTDSEGYSQAGAKKLPSRFLFEIGEDNYIRHGTIPKELMEDVKNKGVLLNGRKKQAQVLDKGSEVEHPMFGKGRIVETDRARGCYKIKFDNLASERNISMDYFANKKKIDTERYNRPAENEKPEEKERIVVKSEPMPQKPPEQKVPEPTDDKPKTYEQKMPELPDDVPKTGWRCRGVSDLGAPVGTCELCNRQIIRYVHHMVHNHYRPLDVGCVCAGKLEGDIEKAKRRESEFKSSASRRKTFKNSSWKTSKGGNSYKKVNDRIIVLYQNKNNGKWSFSIDGKFSQKQYTSRDDAINAAFDALESRR